MQGGASRGPVPALGFMRRRTAPLVTAELGLCLEIHVIQHLTHSQPHNKRWCALATQVTHQAHLTSYHWPLARQPTISQPLYSHQEYRSSEQLLARLAMWISPAVCWVPKGVPIEAVT